MEQQKLFEIIGRLYVDNFGGQQMLTHLQTIMQQKDEEIKRLTGQLLDNEEPDNEGSQES